MSDLSCAMCGSAMVTVPTGDGGFHWECSRCGFTAYPYTITLLREDGLLSGVGKFETPEEATAWALYALALPGFLATYAILTNSVEGTTERILADPPEFPYGEFDDGAHWRQPAQALSPLSPGQWAYEPCVDPEWTEEALDAAVAYMDEIEKRAWLETARAAEWAVQQHVSQWGTEYYG